MLHNLTGWHLIILVTVVALLFGAQKLPGLARSVGQSLRIFRSEVKIMGVDNDDEDIEDESPTPVHAASTPITRE